MCRFVLDVVQFQVIADAFDPLLDADRAATLSDRLEEGIQEDFVNRTQKVGHALHFNRVRAFHWRIYPHVGAGDKRCLYAFTNNFLSFKTCQKFVINLNAKYTSLKVVY